MPKSTSKWRASKKPHEKPVYTKHGTPWVPCFFLALPLAFKGNESEIVVDTNTPVFWYESGDASLLKPGATIFMVAQKKPDGSLSGGRVTAEKDGVKPPI